MLYLPATCNLLDRGHDLLGPDVESAGQVHDDAVEDGVVNACLGEGMEVLDGLGGRHERLLFADFERAFGHLAVFGDDDAR